MDESRRTAARGAITLAEAIIVVLVIAVLAALLLPGLTHQREEGRRVRCRNNLKQLRIGLADYEEHSNHWAQNWVYPCPLGRGQQPNTYNGAEWLAALYWTCVVPDPGVFLCPSSKDANEGGKDIGCKRANDSGGRFSSQTVSYAGMWWKSVNTKSGSALPRYFPDPLPGASEPMACDDTQGTINHGSATNGGMNVLFFDSHVEFWTTAKVDITSATGSVGKKPGSLWRLKN